jgi:hypothetical protein
VGRVQGGILSTSVTSASGPKRTPAATISEVGSW